MGIFDNKEIEELKKANKSLKNKSDNFKKRIEELEELWAVDERNVEIKDLKREIKELKAKHSHDIKMSELELTELKKEATVDGLVEKKKLEAEMEIERNKINAERKSFENTKATLIHEAKREAALEVKEEYIKINEKLLNSMMAMQGISTQNMSELKTIVKKGNTSKN